MSAAASQAPVAISVAIGIGMGIGATFFMDVWNLFLNRVFGIPSLDYCLIGRWVRH